MSWENKNSDNSGQTSTNMGVIDWSHIFSAQGISSIVMFVATMVAMLTVFFFTYGAGETPGCGDRIRR